MSTSQLGVSWDCTNCGTACADDPQISKAAEAAAAVAHERTIFRLVRVMGFTSRVRCCLFRNLNG
jgi:hypothetical protein